MSARHAVVLPLQREMLGDLPVDGELVQRALDGEALALQLLYRRHVRAVTERVTRLLSRSAEAEDVVQDAFVEAFRDLPRLLDQSRFGPWLMRIAVHQVQRRFRRQRLLARFGLDRGCDDARLASIADPGLSPELSLELSRVDAGLARLRSELRLAWMLRYVEGCELLDVAEQCGCSLATAKRRIQRADELLRPLVDEPPCVPSGEIRMKGSDGSR